MNPTLQPILAELRQQLHQLYGPRLVQLLLYGSQARGDAEPGSDIDVLVVLDGPIRAYEEIERTGGIVADLSLKYDVVISCVYVSPQQLTLEYNPFILNVRREAVPL